MTLGGSTYTVGHLIVANYIHFHYSTIFMSCPGFFAETRNAAEWPHIDHKKEIVAEQKLRDSNSGVSRAEIVLIHNE